MQVQLYDTTLRDGAQMEGISFSVEDKLKITRKLDELGVHYIEGGWPGSNPKDVEFFARAQSLALNAEFGVPPDSSVPPILVPRHRLGRMAEELDFHLLELARTKRVVPRIDLVTKRLADLGDAERNLDARRIHDVRKVDEDSLGRLGAEVDSV